MYYGNIYQFCNSYFYHFLHIIFRIYYFLTFGCFFLWPLYCFCVFLLIFYTFLVLFLTNPTDYNLSSGSVFFRVYTDINKDADCLLNVYNSIMQKQQTYHRLHQSQYQQQAAQQPILQSLHWQKKVKKGATKIKTSS